MKFKFLAAVLAVFVLQTSVPVMAETPASAETLASAETPAGDVYLGEGIVAAILDDGFDINHYLLKPLPAGTDLKLSKAEINTRLPETSAYSTAKDAMKNTYKSDKIPFAFDYTKNSAAVDSAYSSGTQTAGIIGASMDSEPAGFNGASPMAQLLLMKVSPGETDDNIITGEIAALAISDALILGADVIFINTSSSPQLAYDDAFISAVDKARSAGVPVFAGAGSGGHMGEESIYDTVYGIKAPVASMTDYGTQSGFSEIPSLVTVAASDNSFNNISSFILGKISDKTEENIIQYTDTNTAYKTTAGKNFAQYFSGAELEYVPIPNVGNMADYGARDKDFLKGKVAVIARGEITFVEKINNAAAFGAAAVIVYESDPDETSGVLMNIDGASIPAIFVSFKSGQKLLFAASGKESPDEKNIISIPEPDPSQISLADFTSTGAGGTLTIAPDFVTEGNFVQAAARNDKIVTVGGGTQYSAVKAAGIYACVKGYLLDTGYTNAGKSDLCELILKLISSSASPVLDEDGTEISPKTQGAGLADVYAATRAEAVIYNTATKASKSELGENKNILKNINRDAEFATLSITVENITNRKISYDLSMSVMTDKAETFDRDELFAVDNVFLEMTGWDADELFGFDPAEPLPYFITGNSEEIPDALAAAGDFNRHLNRASEDFTPMQITLLPGEKRNINITISLSSDTLKKYSAIFENGFFIEGYVFLTPTDGNGTVISHPYMGFCGDWTKSPILSEKRYDSPAAYYGNNVLTANVYNDYFSDPVVLGQNYLVSVDRDMGRTNERLAAISPNLTYTGALSGYPGGLCWIVTPLRDITSHTVTIKSKDTDTVIFKEERGKISKGVLEEHGQIIPHIERLWTCAAEDNSLYLYPDGRYVCEITVYSRLDSEKFSTFSQTVSFEFSIDTTAPELINAEFTEEGGSHYLNVTASDENFIQIIYVTDGYNSYICDDSIFKPAAIVENGQGNEVTLQFDVSEFFDSVSDSEGAYLYIEVVDFAFNSVVHRIFIN